MKVIDFYSYKGGAGRSVTTINTLPLLAKKIEATSENPILLVDMDLDSAGITYLLKKEDEFEQDGKIDTLKYFLGDFIDIDEDDVPLNQHPLFKHTVDISNIIGLENKGVVRFLGINDSLINMGYERGNNSLVTRLNDLINACRNNRFKAVVFDSASGNQEIAQTVLSKSHIIITCMKATSQFMDGTFRYLNALNEEERLRSDAKIVILPVAIPINDVFIAGDLTYREEALNTIRRKLERLNYENIISNFIVKESFGIPEIETFKWREKILNSDKENLTNDEQNAFLQYEELSKIISKL